MSWRFHGGPGTIRTSSFAKGHDSFRQGPSDESTPRTSPQDNKDADEKPTNSDKSDKKS